ncbi:MAG: DUF5372 family protein [Paracoccaceae bacterium]|nr:DUF5372 family protein [Paracoccaceae bacterium]MDE2913605.1 DUF5372 family protein [Paracoccaceae bacterium]
MRPGSAGESNRSISSTKGGLQRMPMSWTSLAPPDPFVETSAGRSPFRVRDLLALSDLVASLEGCGG